MMPVAELYETTPVPDSEVEEILLLKVTKSVDERNPPCAVLAC